VEELLARYPRLRQVVWAQEEPQNMGAWRSIRHRLEETVRRSSAESLQYVGRTWKASPSEGYPTAHQVEQDRIVRTALTAS
jgi:2-oxoglutarate dehydrogenase complex dehydrogenase (E1) component-like enzyme